MNNNLLAGGQPAQDPGIINNSLLQGTFLGNFQQPNATSAFLIFYLPRFVGLLLTFGGLAFFFMLLWGSVTWILSGGDKAHVENAKGRITNALIGFILMVAVFAIITFIETFFGINILSIDIGPLIIQ